MRVGELRLLMAGALSRVGLEERALFPKGPKTWCLPEGDIVRFFQPDPYRRSRGFVYTGYVGIELPQLRDWIAQRDPSDAGIFRHSFIAHHTLNDDDRERFMIDSDEGFSADELAALLRAKVASIPSSIDRLIASYKQDPASLGGLANPIHRAAWDFLLRWTERSHDSLSIPKQGPDGRVTA